MEKRQQTCRCGSQLWELASKGSPSIEPGSDDDGFVCGQCGASMDEAVMVSVSAGPFPTIRISDLKPQPFPTMFRPSFIGRLAEESRGELRAAVDKAVERIIEGCVATFSRRSCLSLIARAFDLAWQERWHEALEAAKLAVEELEGKINRSHFGG